MRRRNPSRPAQLLLWQPRPTKPLRGVPDPDAVLLVTGIAGEWAYVGRMDCGRSREGVLVVEWTQRADALAPRRWVDIERVRVEA